MKKFAALAVVAEQKQLPRVQAIELPQMTDMTDAMLDSARKQKDVQTALEDLVVFLASQKNKTVKVHIIRDSNGDMSDMVITS